MLLRGLPSHTPNAPVYLSYCLRNLSILVCFIDSASSHSAFWSASVPHASNLHFHFWDELHLINSCLQAKMELVSLRFHFVPGIFISNDRVVPCCCSYASEAQYSPTNRCLRQGCCWFFYGVNFYPSFLSVMIGLRLFIQGILSESLKVYFQSTIFQPSIQTHRLLKTLKGRSCRLSQILPGSSSSSPCLHPFSLQYT